MFRCFTWDRKPFLLWTMQPAQSSGLEMMKVGITNVSLLPPENGEAPPSAKKTPTSFNVLCYFLVMPFFFKFRSLTHTHAWPYAS